MTMKTISRQESINTTQNKQREREREREARCLKTKTPTRINCIYNSTRYLPLTYLGLPLGSKFRAQGVSSSIVEIMEWILAGWKKLYLSKGERITLIKSTLSSFTLLFKMPIYIANKLEKLQRDLLLGASKIFGYFTYSIGEKFALP